MSNFLLCRMCNKSKIIQKIGVLIVPLVIQLIISECLGSQGK